MNNPKIKIKIVQLYLHTAAPVYALSDNIRYDVRIANKPINIIVFIHSIR